MAIIREDNGDARASSGTQYALSVGDSFQGSLDPVNDKDWLRVELTAGTIYDIILNGVYSAQLKVLDSRGREIANGINSFSYTKIKIFSPDASGTYYISIDSSNTDRTADYEISLDENPITVVDHEVIADYMISRRPHIHSFVMEAGAVLTVDINALNEAGQQLARWALEAWTNVTGIKFEYVNDDDAQITFSDNADSIATAGRSINQGFIVSAHVNVPASWITDGEARMDSYVFSAYLHEIGHTLGLDHPGPYEAAGSTLTLIDKIFLNDTKQTTVMSYFRQDHDKFVDASVAHPVTPMVADIIAIQKLYGVPVDINPGDTVYGYDSNIEGYLGELFELWSGEEDSSFENPVTLTLYDSDGIDTLDLRTDSANQRVDLRPEGFSNVYGLTGNLIIARDTLIENFIAGSGDDTVFGNDAANYLKGRDGTDHLQGKDGNDILEGGAGADRLDGGTGMDWISYRGSNTAVTVNLEQGTLTGGHAEGDVIIDIENVIGSDYGDVLEGDSRANWFDGGPGNDEISGNAGDDVLEGGPGADRLTGGAGEDTAYYAQSTAEVVVRLHSGEIRGGDAEGDTFAALVTVEYSDSNGDTQQETVPDIEHLRGSAYADTLAGDSRANRLEGGAGDDRLFGGPGGGDDILLGGPGADALYGGFGDDVLEGGADADTLRGGAGADTASYEQSDAGVEVRLYSGVVRGGDAEGDVLDGIENLTGSAYADILAGDAGANRLDGGGGVDWLSYAASDAGVDVRLRNGTGSGGHAEGDVIAGFENIEGSDYNDIFGGDGNDNHLSGGAGSDGLWGSSGNDVLEGGMGADRLYGGGGADRVVYRDSDAAVTINLAEGTGTGGHAEGDTIAEVENVEGSDHNDVLEGDGGVNLLYGGAGDDDLRGAGGDDVLEGGAGADRLDGGTGIDAVAYRSSNEAISVNLGGGTATGGHAEGDEFTGIESIIGSIFGDTLVGGDGNDRLDGDRGDDILEGAGGADRLDGGAGSDTVTYRNSNAAVTVNLGNGTFTGGHAEGDQIVNVETIEGSKHDDVLIGDSGPNRLEGGEGKDELQGGDGDDLLLGGDDDDVLEGGRGFDRLDGGAGTDTVSFASSGEGITVNLVFNDQTIINIENVIGSDYLDSIRGDSGENDLYGRGGDDELNGGAGNDRLFGEDGDDQLWGLSGADRLDGGDGMDIVVYWSSDAAVTVDLEDGTGQGGHAEGDVIVNVENLWGSDHNDVLSGDARSNRLYGSRGNDILEGRGGADRFIFEHSNGDDIILDFTDNEDLIDLSAIGLSGYDELTLSSDSNGVTIDMTTSGGGSILLENFDIANLDALDFIF